MTEGDFVGPIGNASPKYEASNPIVRHLLDRFLRRVDEAAAGLAPTSVLDVGCGEGVVTERLAQLLAPAKVLGVDAAEHLSEEWGARSAPNLSFAAGSAYDLPFADGSFDLVCAIEVLEHLERPRDAIAEMRRVAGRALLLSVPDEPSWRISHMLAGKNVRAARQHAGPHQPLVEARFRRARLRTTGGLEKVDGVFPWTLVVARV